MPVPSLRPPGWRLKGFEEQDHRPNGPEDYDSHDYRDWKQQIAEHEAEGISRPGAVLECVPRIPPRAAGGGDGGDARARRRFANRGLETTHMPAVTLSTDRKFVNVACAYAPDWRLEQFIEFIYAKCDGLFVKTVRLFDVHDAKMHIHVEDIPEDARRPAPPGGRPRPRHVPNAGIRGLRHLHGLWGLGDGADPRVHARGRNSANPAADALLKDGTPSSARGRPVIFPFLIEAGGECGVTFL
jgi:hypothetical protein